MKKIAIIILLLLCVINMYSCKKANKVGPFPPKSKAQLLTEGIWQLTDLRGVYIQSGQPTIIYNFDSLDECSKDNFIVFLTDRRIALNMGDVKCYVGEEQTDTGGYWEFTSDMEHIYLNEGKDQPVRILELTARTFRFALQFVDTSEQQIAKDTFTYTNIR